jgi:hypothetical protein
MEGATTDLARDLMRVGDFDGARRIAEAEIERAWSDSDSTERWRLRFIRAQALEAHGHVEGALSYLESLPAPPADDIESRAALGMYRGAYSGSLGRFQRMGCLAKQKF